MLSEGGGQPALPLQVVFELVEDLGLARRPLEGCERIEAAGMGEVGLIFLGVCSARGPC